MPPLNFRSNDAILYQNIYSLANYKTQKIVAEQLSSRTLFCNSLKENEATKSQRVHTQENVAGTCATLTCSCYTFLCMHVPVMILSLLNITAKCLCNKNVSATRIFSKTRLNITMSLSTCTCKNTSLFTYNKNTNGWFGICQKCMDVHLYATFGLHPRPNCFKYM